MAVNVGGALSTTSHRNSTHYHGVEWPVRDPENVGGVGSTIFDSTFDEVGERTEVLDCYGSDCTPSALLDLVLECSESAVCNVCGPAHVVLCTGAIGECDITSVLFEMSAECVCNVGVRNARAGTGALILE